MARRIAGIAGITVYVGIIIVLMVFKFMAYGDGEQIFKNLPEGCKVEKSFVVPRNQTAAISRKLGVRIRKLTNTVLEIDGERIQVNIISCFTETDAEKAYQAVLKAHGGFAASVALDGKSVAEFVCDDVNLIKRARDLLGFSLAKAGTLKDDLFQDLPMGWEIINSFTVPEDQTAEIAEKLGGQIVSISNTFLSIEDKRLQVNIMNCPTPSEAEKIHANILKMKGDPAFCIRRDKAVVEFVGDDVTLAIKFADELGLKPGPR